MTKVVCKTRLLPAYHAYNNMHKERLGPIIYDEWRISVLSKRHTDEEKAKAIPPIPIDFRNTRLRVLLEAEPQAVKTEVEAWRQARRTAEDSQEKGQVEISNEKLNTASAYHK